MANKVSLGSDGCLFTPLQWGIKWIVTALRKFQPRTQ